MRLICADILDGLADADFTPSGRAERLMRSVETLRYAERWEYGDPVPAGEHQAALDEYEERLADAESEVEETEREGRARNKAFDALETAFRDAGLDDDVLIDAFDAYRAAIA